MKLCATCAVWRNRKVTNRGAQPSQPNLFLGPSPKGAPKGAIPLGPALAEGLVDLPEIKHFLAFGQKSNNKYFDPRAVEPWANTEHIVY